MWAQREDFGRETGIKDSGIRRTILCIASMGCYVLVNSISVLLGYVL